MYDENNVFAKIIRGEIPVTKVYEDSATVAFQDISPAAPKHVLLVPKGKYVSLSDFTAKAGDAVVAGFFRTAAKIAVDLGIEETGYRIIANQGKDASQTVAHFHLHILGGKPLGPLVAGDRKVR